MTFKEIFITNIKHIFNKNIGHYGWVEKRRKYHIEKVYEYIPSEYERRIEEERRQAEYSERIDKLRKEIPFDTSELDDNKVELVSRLMDWYNVDKGIFRKLDSRYWEYIDKVAGLKHSFTYRDCDFVSKALKTEGVPHDGINSYLTLLYIKNFVEEHSLLDFVPEEKYFTVLTDALKNTAFTRLNMKNKSVVERMEVIMDYIEHNYPYRRNHLINLNDMQYIK